jgi:hypothetical protein
MNRPAGRYGQEHLAADVIDRDRLRVDGLVRVAAGSQRTAAQERRDPMHDQDVAVLEYHEIATVEQLAPFPVDDEVPRVERRLHRASFYIQDTVRPSEHYQRESEERLGTSP